MKENNRFSKLNRSIKLGILAGLVITLLSFFIAIVPCIKNSGIGICSLGNPFSDLSIIPTDQFYGISNNPLSGLILQFAIPLIIVFLISFSYHKDKKNNIVDYTKK